MIVPSMATPCTGLGQGLTASMSAYMQGHTHPQQSVSLTLLPLTIIPSSLSVFKEIKSVLFVCITARVLLHACRGQLVGTDRVSLFHHGVSRVKLGSLGLAASVSTF